MPNLKPPCSNALFHISDGDRVHPRAGSSKARGLELEWAILEGVVEDLKDLGLNLGKIESSKVRCPHKSCKAVGIAGPIRHLTGHLRELDEVLDSQHS